MRYCTIHTGRGRASPDRREQQRPERLLPAWHPRTPQRAAHRRAKARGHPRCQQPAQPGGPPGQPSAHAGGRGAPAGDRGADEPHPERAGGALPAAGKLDEHREHTGAGEGGGKVCGMGGYLKPFCACAPACSHLPTQRHPASAPRVGPSLASPTPPCPPPWPHPAHFPRPTLTCLPPPAPPANNLCHSLAWPVSVKPR